MHAHVCNLMINYCVQIHEVLIDSILIVSTQSSLNHLFYADIDEGYFTELYYISLEQLGGVAVMFCFRSYMMLCFQILIG